MLRKLSTATVALTLAVVGLAAAPAPAAAAESNGGARIMPLGASITDGFNVPGGYRVGLWQRLAGAGYTIDFVGSAANGPASLPDHDHEGHSGWRIDQIAANVVNWLQATTPRTVLLHVGTNDVNQDYDLPNAPARLSALIDKIRATTPQVELFVAQIAPESDPAREAKIKTFNAAIPGIVAQKGTRTHLVDMHAVVAVSDLADGTHPTAAGYDKMAARWFTALRSVPGSISTGGTPPAGTTVSVVNPQAQRCLDVADSNTANGTQIRIWDCNGSGAQRWTRSTAGELRVLGTRCLDVNANGTADGTKIQLWNCNGTNAQKFTFNTNGTIVGVGSGKCVDVNANGTANGTLVQLWQCNGTGAQIWSAR